MTTISGLTTQPKQRMSLQIPDGSQAIFSLEYRPQQSGWFFNLTWGTVVINGCRLTAFPNLLRQWKYLLPFGLAVLTAGNVDPVNITDFADGTATLILLDATDVLAVETAAFPGN